MTFEEFIPQLQNYTKIHSPYREILLVQSSLPEILYILKNYSVENSSTYLVTLTYSNKNALCHISVVIHMFVHSNCEDNTKFKLTMMH